MTSCSEDRLKEIILDKKLANLGDAYLNFLFSLALTKTSGGPVGIKVSDRVLAEAARRTGIRELLPSRTSRGDVGNSIEALVVYSWLNKQLTLEESAEILAAKADDPAEAVSHLVREILKRIGTQLHEEI